MSHLHTVKATRMFQRSPVIQGSRHVGKKHAQPVIENMTLSDSIVWHWTVTGGAAFIYFFYYLQKYS